MGFSVVATVVGGVIGGAMWGLAGGIDMPTVSLQEVGTSDVVSLNAVLSLRLICAAVALHTLLCVYFNRAGLELRYRGATVHLYRLSRWTTFTVWCFTSIFLYFALAAYCSGMSLAGRGQPIHPAIVQATLILFEVSYPMSLLVTVVVTFVLIPTALRTDHPIPRMFRWRPLMMHNGNVLMMQLAMLSAPPPVTLSHLPYALLFGCAYAIFSWLWFRRTQVFYYFFLDYRRSHAIFAYLGLFTLLNLFYGLSYVISCVASQSDSRWWTYPLIGLATLGMTRFRPPTERGANFLPL
jgi:hypothetical protein